MTGQHSFVLEIKGDLKMMKRTDMMEFVRVGAKEEGERERGGKPPHCPITQE